MLSEPSALPFVLPGMFSEERISRMDQYEKLDLDGLLKLERSLTGDVDLLLAIGRCYLRRQELALCFAYYNRALVNDPNDGWTHLYMGSLCYGIGCYEEAEEHFNTAVALLPGVSCPHWCLGDVYAKQGYWKRTEQAYRRAVESDAQDQTAIERLEGWLAQKLA